MERCTVCGADLSPGIDWCGRCHTPRNTAHPAYHGPGSLRPEDRARLLPPPREPVEVEFSARRGGPTSFGWIGRSVTTLVALLFAWWVYVYAFPFMLGSPTGPFFLLYTAFAAPVLVVVLRRIWRPTRIR